MEKKSKKANWRHLHPQTKQNRSKWGLMGAKMVQEEGLEASLIGMGAMAQNPCIYKGSRRFSAGLAESHFCHIRAYLYPDPVLIVLSKRGDVCKSINPDRVSENLTLSLLSSKEKPAASEGSGSGKCM